MYFLMKMSEKPMDTNVSHAFMGRVKTEENTRKCCQDKQTVENNKL